MAAGRLSSIARFGGRALDIIFPLWCVGCGREGHLICPDCINSLSRIEPPLCPRCGLPQPQAYLCPSCLAWQASIDGIRSPFSFTGAIRAAVHQLKYQHVTALASPLAGLLAAYLDANAIPADVLVPVPLYPRRLRERGYNQSALLARRLGQRVGMPVIEGCLVRQRPALPQARSESVDQRRANVAGAFACRDRRLSGKRVLLIDDVATSGATLDACAAALKTAGATAVWGLTLAREI